MANLQKGLVDLIRDGTFEARRERHRALLDDADQPKLPFRDLERIRKKFQREDNDDTRRRLALEFERAVRAGEDDREQATAADLEHELAKLGPRGSAKRVKAFFPRFFKWDDGTPFRLDGWQASFIDDAYTREKRRRGEELGRRVYKEILLGIGRGLGKTPIATGIGLEALVSAAGRSRVFHASGSKEQADLGVEYAANWIEETELEQWLRARSHRIDRRDKKGFYTIMSAGGALGHGRKPNVGIVDEWWGFTTYAQTQTYTALETAINKTIQDAFLMAISTAGHDKETQLGQAYESAFELPIVETHREGFLTIARDPEAGRLMWWFGMPDGYELDLDDDKAVLRALKLALPGSWIDHGEILRALRRTRDPHEWLRLYLNHWTVVKEAWFPRGAWAACESPLEIPDGADIYVGVDAAHSWDATAVSWAWRAPNGRIVVRTKVWSLRHEAPADVHVNDVELNNELLVEPFIHDLGARYRIREVVYDPNFFGTEGRHLGERYNTAPIFPQSVQMREAVNEFYGDVLRKRIAHEGNRTSSGKVLRAHVAAVVARKNSDGYWVIRSINQRSPIDGCVAAIIASDRARRAPKKKGGKVVSWR